MSVRLTPLGWITAIEGVALCVIPAWQSTPLAITGGIALLSGLAIARGLAQRNLANVEALWSLPRTIHAGSEVTLSAAVSASDSSPPCTLSAWNPRTRTPQEVARLAAVGTVAMTPRWTVRFPARGLVHLPPLVISGEQPFGLIRTQREAGLGVDVVVLPTLGRVRAAMRVRLEQWFAGIATSPEPGGDDLARLRAWTPGDAPARVHWRASARHRALLVAERHAPAARRLTIAIDPHAPPAVFERLVAAAATLIDDLARQQWELVVHHGQVPRGVSGARDRLLEALAMCKPGGASLDEVVPRGAPCLVLIDDNTTPPTTTPPVLAIRDRELPRLIYLPKRVAVPVKVRA